MGVSPLPEFWPYQDLPAGRLCFPSAIVAAFVLARETEAPALEYGPDSRAPHTLPQRFSISPLDWGLRHCAQAHSLVGPRDSGPATFILLKGAGLRQPPGLVEPAAGRVSLSAAASSALSP
ncbi:Hypothetical predicted protein [Marmota monax]|uniref:Uncharacterized protein n=1 Tax=Marmota monax TaxID=9995 RepID=A0A5E4A9L3_MARMO|nr:Hypothetical predicted protein [Marmota monax]